MRFGPGRTAERTALLGLLAASAIGAAAGARFYPHYYVQLIPPLALLAAPYYARLWSRTIQPPHWLLRPEGDLRVAGSHGYCLVNRALDGPGSAIALPSEAGRYLFSAFEP